MAGAGMGRAAAASGVAANGWVAVAGRGVIGEGGTRTAGVVKGVGGPEEAGEGVSTTHMRWERVATSFAMVCARVEYGFTWKTGKESFPSLTPRSERMTEMKWIQEELRRGREVDFVKSCCERLKCAGGLVVGGMAYADIDERYVADDVVLDVEDGEGAHAFVVHELEGVG